MSWEALLRVRVDGEPRGQPRPRASVRGRRVRVYDPGTAEHWKCQIAQAVKAHRPEAPIDQPCRVTMSFEHRRPKRLLRKKDPQGPVPHLVKPDIDNAAKAVLDALVDVGVLRDDTVVCELVARKRYHAKTGRPGMDLVVEVRGVADACAPSTDGGGA